MKSIVCSDDFAGMCVNAQTTHLNRCKPSLAQHSKLAPPGLSFSILSQQADIAACRNVGNMTLATLNFGKDDRAKDGAAHREADEETVNPAVATDPRPLPATHVRHLDVNKVLERSLPRVEDAPRKFSRND